MKIHDVKQNSPEWAQLRAGIVTASEMDCLITPSGEPRKGDGVKTYLAKKLAERWIGGPLPTYSGGPMLQGQLKEGEALGAFSVENNTPVASVGFITSDDGTMGCSPDGWITLPPDNYQYGIECKCPLIETHCRYLLDGGNVPKEYVPQVQGSMFVTGADRWKFVSYARGLPLVNVTVLRDEEFHKNLALSIANFNLLLDRNYERLLELNGGPPQREQFINESVVVQTLEGIDENALDAFLKG